MDGGAPGSGSRGPFLPTGDFIRGRPVGDNDRHAAPRPRPQALRIKRGRRRRPGRDRSAGRPRVGSSPYPGLPYPLGATPYQGGTNFAVVADGVPGVSDVQLCLMDPTDRRHAAHGPMDERTYGIWHTFVPGRRTGPGLRVPGAGPGPGEDPARPVRAAGHHHRVRPGRRRVARRRHPGQGAAGRGRHRSTGGCRSTSVRPWVPWEQTVIYEAHVVGLTKLHPDGPARAARARSRGSRTRPSSSTCKSLSVTTLELLPVQASAAEPGLLATDRRNYWGYSTLGYFAPHPRYATRARPGDRRVHRDGRRAARGGHRGRPRRRLQPHLRGRAGSDGRPVLARACRRSRTTCRTAGTSPAPATRSTPRTLPVIRMVTDSLRYWADTLGVDGFRFDLASVHARPDGGPFDPGSALLRRSPPTRCCPPAS